MKEAHDACCSLSMGLVSLETPQKTKDLALFKQNLSETSSFVAKCIKIMFSTATKTVEIWTSAVQTDCDFKFKWCSSGEKLLRNDSIWFIIHVRRFHIMLTLPLIQEPRAAKREQPIVCLPYHQIANECRVK